MSRERRQWLECEYMKEKIDQRREGRRFCDGGDNEEGGCGRRCEAGEARFGRVKERRWMQGEREEKRSDRRSSEQPPAARHRKSLPFAAVAADILQPPPSAAAVVADGSVNHELENGGAGKEETERLMVAIAMEWRRRRSRRLMWLCGSLFLALLDSSSTLLLVDQSTTATMSEEGEKTCPLCAEEMDLTDQQLRPCKCGYEICVWCWHHIMDMAEKDNTEGRCPACRTPYNKEKIVGTASKCERLVTGMSVEKKQKSQKGKTKTSEGRKQLGSVRVIQRNLVYIVGLPLNLADEDILQQKEYFGQYGKVLKVSISRTAAGAIQQFANSTCSVYITYSKEEEAIRSIQSAHGFILEGRTLRVCFGTTKYCHAWLRNMPCTNADCLYLHEFGPEEDSFTKDEIITAYTRNRVQQITGVTNDMQRRSGNLLPPPPADDYSNNNTDTSSAWEKPINKTTTTTNNPANGMKVPLPNSSSGKSTALPAAASWGTRASNRQPSFKELVVEKGSLGNNPVSIKEDVDKNISNKLSHPSDISRNYSNPVPDEERIINNLSFDMSLSSINNNQRLQACESEPLTSNEAENTTVLVSDVQKKVAISVAEEDMMSFNDERLGDTEAIQNLPPNSSPPNNPMGCYPLHACVSPNGGVDPPSSHLANNNIPITVNDYSSTVIGNSSSSRELLSNGHSYFHGSTEGCKSEIGDLGESSIISNILSMDFDPWDESLTSPQNLAKFLDKQPESHSHSHSHRVLSSRNSNQSRFSFARQDEGSNNGDFGFEYKNSNSSDFVSNKNNSIYIDKKHSNYNNGSNGFSSFSFEESENFATNNFPMSENKISVSRTQVSAPPPGFSGVSISRAPPPGFTSQERMEQKQTFDTPTPTLSLSGNHMLLRNMGGGGDLEFMDPAILAVGGRVNSNSPPGRGFGLDMRSNFPSFNENDVRLQVLMQRSSFSQQQNPRRLSEVELDFPQQINSYAAIPSRMVDNNHLSSHYQTSFQQQQQLARRSLISSNNGHWNENNDMRLGLGLGLNNGYYHSAVGVGHEDTKFHFPTSPDLYNTTFGI
ncbi:unnamed protein product [Lactuca virosa]|uniref:CCR4-NOT transcription complex subunit 4 n=1 Tax=Lactuca virosa TaxID=75947 RepID=A0AAU9LTY7_9ASTR|nr:unnamed protein product [Lactuca virosa]